MSKDLDELFEIKSDEIPKPEKPKSKPTPGRGKQEIKEDPLITEGRKVASKINENLERERRFGKAEEKKSEGDNSPSDRGVHEVDDSSGTSEISERIEQVIQKIQEAERILARAKAEILEAGLQKVEKQ